MLELISYSYKADFRNRIFSFEGQWKYEKIYDGNKAEFAKLYLSLILEEFESSVQVWQGHSRLARGSDLNLERIAEDDDSCQLEVDVQAFYAHCAELDCLKNIVELNRLQAGSIQGGIRLLRDCQNLWRICGSTTMKKFRRVLGKCSKTW